MTSAKLDVHLGSRPQRVGVLTFQSQGGRQHSSFAYDEDWIAAAGSFPIAPGMPFARRIFHTSKQNEPHSFAFPGAIADTCPDSWGQAILRRDGKTRGRNTTDLDLLAGVNDTTRVGALRFRDGAEHFVRAQEAGRPIAPPLVEIEALMRAADAVEAQTETARDLARLLGDGSSLGGARPKCNVLDGERLAIAKFTSKRDTMPVERAEVATLRLARRCGIDTPNADLVVVAGRAIAVIQRFDKTTEGGRRPYISAQTMLDLSDATHGSYEAMAEAIRAHGDGASAQLQQLFRRVAFTILVSNVDDHLKNHGFLHVEHGRWRLAPAFDINPSPERTRSLKTRIVEDGDDEASISALLSSAGLYGLSSSEADAVVATMAATIAGGWRPECRKAGLSKREIDAYRDAFEHEEQTVAASRGATSTAKR